MPDFASKPTQWSQFLALLNNSLTKDLLRARLLELAFSQDSAVSVRAIELFLSMGSDSGVRPLGDLSLDQLQDLENVVAKRLRATAVVGSEPDDSNGTGAAADAGLLSNNETGLGDGASS